MDFFIQATIFLVSTFVLVKSADYFIEAVEKLGHCWKMPHFITGVLLVAIGTSLPEFSTSIASVLKDETDMLAGNVLGTVIANVFLGLGLMSVLTNTNIKFERNIFAVHFPIFIFSVTLAILTMFDGKVTWEEGIFFLGTCAAYLWFLFAKKEKDDMPDVKFSWKLLIIPVLGLVGLAISSEFVIRSIIVISELLGFEKTVLAATLVAVGTSLPEMLVVWVMIKKRNFDMIVGNILGSNIFDILLIFGIGSLISPLQISTLSLQIIAPFMVATLLIYWGVSKDKEITKQEGLAMTFLYIFFIGKLYGIL